MKARHDSFETALTGEELPDISLVVSWKSRGYMPDDLSFDLTVMEIDVRNVFHDELAPLVRQATLKRSSRRKSASSLLQETFEDPDFNYNRGHSFTISSLLSIKGRVPQAQLDRAHWYMLFNPKVVTPLKTVFDAAQRACEIAAEEALIANQTGAQEPEVGSHMLVRVGRQARSTADDTNEDLSALLRAEGALPPRRVKLRR